MTVFPIMGRHGRTCAVAICRSPLDAIYHRFPKDLNLQKVWVQACKREGKIPVATARVCSSHFKEEDYQRDIQHELLNLPLRRLLKDNAVPTLNLAPGEFLQS